ncbi:hypothetical protein [Cupriavidus necator]
MRTINIHLDATEVSTRRRLPATSDAYSFDGAIAYLSLWNMNFQVVDIYSDGDRDMTAYYRRDGGSTGYVIGAIWRESEGRYSFHS